MRDATAACCRDCRSQITIATDGTEYGHERGKGIGGVSKRCPRRPASVDPTSQQGGTSA
jgi:hypothetical protein